jgi:sulfite reductase alpha subunit-like flavoprotein
MEPVDQVDAYTWTVGGTFVPGIPYESHQVVSTVTDAPTGFTDLVLTTDGKSYTAGDHLAVFPPNRQVDIDNMLKLVDVGADTAGVIGGDAVQGTHLGRRVGNTVGVRHMIADLLDLDTKLTDNHVRRFELDQDAVVDTRLVDALVKAGKHVSIVDLLNAMDPIMPRLYSIASSRRDQVRIGVKVAEHGLCSTYINRLHPGDTVYCEIKPSTLMRLPPTDDPLYFISAGSGITPFMGLVEQYRNDKWPKADTVGDAPPTYARVAGAIKTIVVNQPAAHPPAIQFYHGTQTKANALYVEDLGAYADNGVIDPHYAYSREGDKQYVQQVLLENRDKIKADYDNGARFFFCGAGNVKKGVIEALATIIGVAAEQLVDHLGPRLAVEVF